MQKVKRSSQLLFYDAVGPINISNLSKKTGIPASTLSRWKKIPESMPLEGAVIIARARKISREEWGSLI